MTCPRALLIAGEAMAVGIAWPWYAVCPGETIDLGMQSCTRPSISSLATDAFIILHSTEGVRCAYNASTPLGGSAHGWYTVKQALWVYARGARGARRCDPVLVRSRHERVCILAVSPPIPSWLLRECSTQPIVFTIFVRALLGPTGSPREKQGSCLHQHNKICSIINRITCEHASPSSQKLY